jgi:hypothetical protein
MLGTSRDMGKARDIAAIRQELLLALLAGGLAMRDAAISPKGARRPVRSIPPYAPAAARLGLRRARATTPT